MPKIESNIIIGYSNFDNFLSNIKFFDELSTNKLEIKIKILKKFEKASRVKLSKNIFSTLFGLFKIIAIVSKIINELKLKIKLKLFLMNVKKEVKKIHTISQTHPVYAVFMAENLSEMFNAQDVRIEQFKAFSERTGVGG